MHSSKPDHLATWTSSFTAAAFGVWSTWETYVAMGLRDRVWDWVLLYERPLFATLLVLLMAGTLVTAYEARLFPRDLGEPSPQR